MQGKMSREDLMAALGLKDEKHFREYYQQAGIALGVIEMTLPDKPRSSKQKYRLTEKRAQGSYRRQRKRKITNIFFTCSQLQPFSAAAAG